MSGWSCWSNIIMYLRWFILWSIGTHGMRLTGALSITLGHYSAWDSPWPGALSEQATPGVSPLGWCLITPGLVTGQSNQLGSMATISLVSHKIKPKSHAALAATWSIVQQLSSISISSHHHQQKKENST